MNPIYQVVEWIGVSEIGIEEAILDAISKAAQLHGPFDWYEVMQTQREVSSQSKHYRAHLKLGCHAH